MQARAIQEFGKELHRDFEVHENCYDCGEFYDGCEGWRPSQDFDYRRYYRLPNVLPGTCGQRIPPPRRQPPVSFEFKPIEHQPAESSRQTDSEPDIATRPKSKRRRRPRRAISPARQRNARTGNAAAARSGPQAGGGRL